MFACVQCHGVMKKTTLSQGNCFGVLCGLAVVFIGIALTLCVPIFGWIAGPLLCVVGLFMGGTRQKVWKCVRCGSYINRA